MNSNLKILLIVGTIVLGTCLLFRRDGQFQNISTIDSAKNTNVAIVDGQQIVTIAVKGGYSPQTSVINADVPTVLRFVTNGTFDCSSAIRIPSLGITENLSPTGTIDIDVGKISSGILQGTCSMGMYNFSLRAE